MRCYQNRTTMDSTCTHFLCTHFLCTHCLHTLSTHIVHTLCTLTHTHSHAAPVTNNNSAVIHQYTLLRLPTLPLSHTLKTQAIPQTHSNSNTLSYASCTHTQPQCHDHIGYHKLHTSNVHTTTRLTPPPQHCTITM